MTNDEFFDMVQKRYDRGLSFKRPSGRDTQWESFQYALELHRLMPYAADVKPQYILRLIQERLKGGRRTKYQVRQDLAFHERLSEMFDGKPWPRPVIPNSKHDTIRMHLQSLQRAKSVQSVKSVVVTLS